jgi:hypothetical protein
MTWLSWGPEKPRDGELFVALYYTSPFVCRYIEPAQGLNPEVHVNDLGPVGIGPMNRLPDAWCRLPEVPNRQALTALRKGGEAA